VELCVAPEELPDLVELAKGMGLPATERRQAGAILGAEVVRSVLRSMGVDRMVLVRHLHCGREVTFFALHSAFDDQWRDLQGHDLTVKAYANTA
jgi:hypothetical protein